MTAASWPGFEDWSRLQRERVEQALCAWVAVDALAGLGDAMRYAVLDGGKRLRPLLVLAAAQALGIDVGSSGDEASLRAACAVELIHAYSLVHDDMPCMDNDVLRRGKPTVHVQFGEAQALLAGDALQALAFELLTPDECVVSADVQALLCRLLARAAGHAGMAGGQAIDLASVGRSLTQPQLQQMHKLKTGALLLASVQMGAVCGGAADGPAFRALTSYGDVLGLAFQVVDDILDVSASAATLGKTAGKDAAADKPTFVSLMGLDGSRKFADALCQQALAALDTSGLAPDRTATLRALALAVVDREH